ncbi:MAG: Rid family hydrolase [Alphaproteobacteria bacterium]
MEFEEALRYVTTARAEGAARNATVTVAILDAAGHPVLVARGKPDTWHGPYMAMGKARLAAAFRKPTAELLEKWEDRPLFAQSLTEVIPGGVTLNKGGYPIFRDGRCIGAIGVGGGAPEVDDAVARATVEKLAGDVPAPANDEANMNDTLEKRPIRTDGAPTPTGPFNQAMVYGNLVFTSGQAGRNRETGQMGDIRDQARRCITNIANVLDAAGSSLAHLLKVTVFLKNAADWKAFNEVYVELVPEPRPARSSAVVSLKTDDMLVEMEAVAYIPQK